MSKFLTLFASSLALFVSTAQAQAPLKPQPQLDKTAMCDKAAGARKGDERKAFLRTCMAAKSETQPDKVAGCHGARAEDL